MVRQPTILYAACFLMDAAVAGLSFAVSRRAAELGASAWQLGWLGATWVGAYALSAVVLGRVAERRGRRATAQAGCLGCAVLALACGWTTGLPGLLALMSAFGVSLAAFWPAVIGWLSADARDSVELNGRLRYFSVAWNVGLVLGFALAGWLFRYEPRLVFVVAAGLAAGNAWLLSWPARADGTTTGRQPMARVPSGRGFRKTAWLANFGLSLASAGAAALFPQLATALGIAPEVHGGMLALGRGAALLVFVFLPLWTFWRVRLWPLWVAQAAAVVAVSLLGWADETFWLALSFFVTGAVSGYTYQASVFFTMEEMEVRSGGGGLHEAVHALGMAVGPVLAGGYGQQAGLRAPYYLCAGLLGLLMVAQMVLVAWRRRQGRDTNGLPAM